MTSLSPVRVLRLLGVGYLMQLKIMAASPFQGVLQVVWPLFFATASLLSYRTTGSAEAMVYAGLGTAAMGMWSSVATEASGALQRERWAGTFELRLAAPTPFPLTLLPITLAQASLGLGGLAATLLWGRLVFDIPFQIRDPLIFMACAAATVVAVAMFGFLLAVVAVRYRAAWALGDALESPGWLLCGFVVPLGLLPPWSSAIGKALPPTWGMEAMRDAAAGGSPWSDLSWCIGLGAGYALVATFASQALLAAARRRATLSLS